MQILRIFAEKSYLAFKATLNFQKLKTVITLSFFDRFDSIRAQNVGNHELYKMKVSKNRFAKFKELVS